MDMQVYIYIYINKNQTQNCIYLIEVVTLIVVLHVFN